MRITQRVTLALGLAFVVLCALLWSALQLSVAPQFTTFELEKAQDNFSRAQNAVERELNQLEAYRRDYGVWDDAYDYVSGSYPAFLDEELPLSLLKELNVSLYLYFNADGSLIDGVAIDERFEDRVSIETYAPQRFNGWKGFQNTLKPNDVAQTILKTNAGLMLIAYAPVTNTDGGGEYAGHLLTGRLVEAGFIQSLQDQTRVEMWVSPLEDAMLERAAAQSVERANGFVTVSAPLAGADGAPIAQLTARTPCDITLIGQHTIFSTFLWLTGVTLLFIAIVAGLVKILAVRPIERLTEIMKGADDAKPVIDEDLSVRTDEVGVLYSSFTALLNRIDQRTQELASALTAAESAERAKTQFLANMSHEIRTPMNGVMGMAELLASTKLTQTQKSFVDVIVKSGDALLTIINDILDFSKLDAGMTNLNMAPFALADVVEGVTSLVAPKANKKNLELAVRIDPKLPLSFTGDAGRLRQVLMNLVGNAVKFTERGYVMIDVSPVSEPDEERVALKVSIIDTGMGIPEHKCADIFEKFSQADNSSTRIHEGTGLGLAIAKALVELMGGEIGVESEPGRGSNFWFTIVLQVNTEDLPEIEEAAEITGARLLIVDDNEINRRILEEQAAAWGCAAQSCDSGAAALTVLKKAYAEGAAYDAVIMDYQMPGMNGAEAARCIRDEQDINATPVIMLTSVDHANEGGEFEALGVSAHLTKPARSAALQRAIGVSLRRESQRHAPSVPPQDCATEAPKTDASPEAVDVLVVEDNEVNRLVMSHLLKADGHVFEMAVNGVEAIEKFKSLKPRIILMDISMPEMNGIDATREIRRIEAGGARTPIIGVTAHAVEGDSEECYDCGMDDYVPKPVSPAKLSAKIAKYLAAAKSDAA